MHTQHLCIYCIVGGKQCFHVRYLLVPHLAVFICKHDLFIYSVITQVFNKDAFILHSFILSLLL